MQQSSNLVHSYMYQAKNIVVGVGDCKVTNDMDAIVVTYSLGSCIGLVAFDTYAAVGGILHFMLPSSSVAIGEVSPYRYADTGIQRFLNLCYQFGAKKERLVLKAAGGGCMMDLGGHFDIGKKNYNAMMKVLDKNKLSLRSRSVGGEENRTVRLDVSTGRILVKMPKKGIFEL